MRRISLLTLPVLFAALTAAGANAQHGRGASGGMHSGAGFQHGMGAGSPSLRGSSIGVARSGSGLAPRGFGVIGVGTPGIGRAGVGTPGFGPAGVGMPGFRTHSSFSVFSTGRAPTLRQPSNFNRQFAAGQRHGGHDGGRRPSRGRDRRSRSGFGIFGYNTYFVPNLVGYPYGFGLPFYGDEQDDNNESAADQSANYPENPGQPADEAEGPDAERMPAADNYRPQYQPDLQQQVSEQVNPQPATTLIFNNGQPSEQVHDYVLTSTTLYGFDNGVRREIPLSELNVPATIAANRSAGVDFALPGG